MLARNPDVAALERARCDRLFGLVLRDQPLILNIVLTDVRGELRGTGVPGPAPLGPVARAYIGQVVATKKPVVSELMVGRLSRKPTIVLAYPVTGNDGKIVGVLGLGLDLARLQQVFSSIALPDESVITLTDSASRVIVRSRDAERFIGTAITASPEEPRDVAPSAMRVGPDGIERFYGNAVIDRGPWLLSVGIPSSVVASSVAGLRRRNVIIATIAITGIMAAALWFSAILSRGLNRLRAGVQRIADGDLSPPAKNSVPNLELRQLQDAFITMAANLRETRAALDRQVEQERKMREALQSLQRQVVRQERLAAVGVLVSGVAHELNNPLQAILGTAELLERQEDLSAAARDEIAFVKTQSGRAREIIRNLSRFSSQQSGPPSFIDLRDVITEVIQLRRRDLDTSSIALDVEIASARTVYANFTETRTGGAQLRDQRTAGDRVVRPSQRTHPDSPLGLGKRVRLEVLDNGAGVSADDEPKLFQPFFTTKPVGKGTGLGLSVSYGIIDSYGGLIGYLENEWGGATFFFELPGTDMPATPLQGAPPALSQDTHDGEAVLHRPISPRI